MNSMMLQLNQIASNWDRSVQEDDVVDPQDDAEDV